MEKAMIISNNPLVWDRYPGCQKINGTYVDVLITARDYIHQGSSLLNHPLAGSIKPNETPYKSLVLKIGQGPLDYKSLSLIESAVETFHKFTKLERDWPQGVINDFQLVDGDLLESALEALSKDIVLRSNSVYEKEVVHDCKC